MKKKALFIVGPTASGKTDLAFLLASHIQGNLINTDSVQVYKGLNIISGKDIIGKFHPTSWRIKFPLRLRSGRAISKSEFDIGFYTINQIPIYLLDIFSPSYEFNIHDYVSIAVPTIEMISSNGPVPIIVGGSGFYVKALLDGIDTMNIPQNVELRQQLDLMSVEELQGILSKENVERLEKMNNSDINNKRRLIRAIEVGRFGDVPKEEIGLVDFDVKIIGLFSDRDTIKKRIDTRIQKRIQQGALDEAKKLFTNYKSLSNQVKNANGYRELFQHLLGNMTLEEAIEKWRRAEYLTAKKQMTWFQKDKRIEWFDILDEDFRIKARDVIQEWLKE